MSLASPTLPIGAFAYSDGLEAAVELGWVRDEGSARDWIAGRLLHQVARTELPVVRQCHAAWPHDLRAMRSGSELILALQDTREVRSAQVDQGRALARVLVTLGHDDVAALTTAAWISLPAAFAVAAVCFDLDVHTALVGYAWSWADAQINAAIKLVPLGQSQGQRLLHGICAQLDAVVEIAMHADDVGQSAPSVSLAQAHHETQYARLFRS